MRVREAQPSSPTHPTHYHSLDQLAPSSDSVERAWKLTSLRPALPLPLPFHGCGKALPTHILPTHLRLTASFPGNPIWSHLRAAWFCQSLECVRRRGRTWGTTCKALGTVRDPELSWEVLLLQAGVSWLLRLRGRILRSCLAVGYTMNCGWKRQEVGKPLRIQRHRTDPGKWRT